MSRHTSFIAGCAVVFLLAGCGVSDAQLTDDDVASESGELGTTSRTYVVFRHDMRRCASPMCGGWFVHDVNRASVREVYVPGFDFTGSGLTEEQQQVVTSGGNFEVVLYGKLGALKNGYRDFVVSSAWRGLPGVTFTEGKDSFFRASNVSIQCITAPCPSMKASKLHSTSTTLFHDLTVERASKPFVDQNWLVSRITDRDALVAGVVRDGAQVGAGVEKVLDATQVFLKIPDALGPCGRPALPLCASPRVNTFVRDTNRCTFAGSCVKPGVCAQFVPACAEGYSLQQWTGGPNACPQYACDPSFL
ncbi:MAG: DUF6748 domain-containing protein [Myxococcaceae bacterium]